MCGIAGVLRQAPLPDPSGVAGRLAQLLGHRGPDDTGCFRGLDDRLLLVHRRLAIIDPSPAGHQPMAGADRRYSIVYNGEAYNFRDLKARLESRGERFSTHADTEVLLRLLALDGPGALAQGRGMFALALWDAQERSLLVARDRFGIKPLYVAESPAQVAIASEIRSLVGSGLVAPEVDAAGVLAYLRWGSIPPPLTWLRGVTALEPGTWRRWTADGRATGGRFADVRTAWSGAPRPVPIDELVAHTRAALVDSVTAHLVADVPVGLFLSGGIDSAAVVSAARAAGRQLHTYTVVVGEDRYSEAREAQEVAARFETVHHTLHVDAGTVARDWPTILDALDQPTGDAVNTFYASRAVAATGVKAVLSGVGGDEMFGGYPSFQRLPRALGWSRALGPLLPLAGRAASAAAREGRGVKWRHFADSRGQPGELYRALRGFLMPAEAAAFAGPALAGSADALDRVTAVEDAMLAPRGDETPEASVARLESTVYLRSQLLRDVDAMSMAHGLEVRVPFVDHELLDTVWPAIGAHPAWLLRKRLLVAAAPIPLPEAVTQAPKRGFTLPFEEWMKGPLAEPIVTGLAHLSSAGWVTPEIARVWREWQDGEAHWSRPWTLGVLGHFLEEAARARTTR